MACHSKFHEHQTLKIFVLAALVLLAHDFILASLARAQVAGSTPPVLIPCIPSEESAYPTVPNDFSRRHKPPLILAVDGFSPWAELTKYESLTEYLKGCLNESANIKNMNGEIKTFRWTGDTKDTPIAVDDLKRSILHAVEVSRNDQRTLAIVAHSWGGVLVYRALHELENDGRLRAEDIDLLITLGTPLKWFAMLGVELRKPRSVDTWSNYWADGDNISGPIRVANNVELPKVQFRDHSSYYQNREFREMIGAEIATAVIDHDQRMSVPPAGTTRTPSSTVQKKPSLSSGVTPVPSPQLATAPSVSFAAYPNRINKNESSTLAWHSTGADQCTFSGGWAGRYPTYGSITVHPLRTTAYGVTCVNSGGSASRLVTVTVVDSGTNPEPGGGISGSQDQTTQGLMGPSPPIVSLTANPTRIAKYQSSTLAWHSTGADQCTFSGGWAGRYPTYGSITVHPLTTKTYVVTCVSSGGSTARLVIVTVSE